MALYLWRYNKEKFDISSNFELLNETLEFTLVIFINQNATKIIRVTKESLREKICFKSNSKFDNQAHSLLYTTYRQRYLAILVKNDKI